MTVTSATSSSTAAGLMNLLNSSQTTSAQSAEKRREKAMEAAFKAAASTLGMSTDDLTTALKSGQSLTSLASSAGVSTDTLTSAISTALQGSDSTLSSDRADGIATSIVTGTPPPPPPGQDGTGSASSDSNRGAAFGKALDAAASELGLSGDQLRSDLSSGSSLEDIASQQGVSSADLTSTLSSALSAADSSLTSTQATQIAQRLAQGHPGNSGSDTSQDQQGNPFDVSGAYDWLGGPNGLASQFTSTVDTSG